MIMAKIYSLKNYNLGGSNALYSLPFVAYLQHSPNKNEYNWKKFEEKSNSLRTAFLKKFLFCVQETS